MDEHLLQVAELLAQSEIDEGIRRVLARIPKQPIDFDGLCIDCDDPIPSGRIKVGAITCLPCQVRREHKALSMSRPT